MSASAEQKSAEAALALHGSIRAAARALGVPYATFHGRLNGTATRGKVTEAAPPPPAPGGQLRAKGRVTMALPEIGKCKTYIITSAQNNTKLHEAAWSSLLALAEYDDAQILVGAFAYAVNAQSSNGEKRKTSREAQSSAEVWDERLTPYMANDRIEIAPGLVWCGDLQILPTASNPISGLESLTGRDSSIFPHVQHAMTSVASPKNKGTKLIYTTGAITLRNYIQKKAGQKAEFHHSYGAVIVEVLDDGSWFVRQLNADSEGVIYDLDRKADCGPGMVGRVTTGHRPEGIVYGDIHSRRLEPSSKELIWGRDGIAETLRPKRQALHDILDFRSQNHHDRKDPWRTYEKHVTDSSGVADEVSEAASLLSYACRPWCETVVVRSNHDEALSRWAKEADWRDDPQNALFLLDVNRAKLKSCMKRERDFDVIEWAFRDTGEKFQNVKFLRRDEEYIVCAEAGGGIELGMHGDKGANGARGSLIGYARSGRKCIVGHSHSAGIREGAMQVGVSAALDMDYNEGPSSWSHTHAIVYPNGKRTLITVWQGKWKADKSRRNSKHQRIAA